jgi:hypothetical protein
MARVVAKWFATACADARLRYYGNGRRPDGAFAEDRYKVTTKEYDAATALLARTLTEVPADDFAPGREVRQMCNKVCRSLGSTSFPTRAKRAVVFLQGGMVTLSRQEVESGTPRTPAGSGKQIAAYATDILLRSCKVTDASFPTRFVDKVIELMHDCGYHESYVATPGFELLLRKRLNDALNAQGRDSSAPARPIRRELVGSEAVAQPIRVACLLGEAGTRLPRCHAS